MRLSVFNNSALRTLLIAAVMLISACSKQTSTPQAEISGPIHADAAMTLPQGAQLQVRLTDVTGNADGAAEEIAVTTSNLSSLPAEFVLPFDPARIDSTHRYTVDARIIIAGAPRYGTDTPYPVLTEGHDRRTDIRLIALGDAGTAATPTNAIQEEVIRGELRANQDVTLYSAGIRDGAIVWIKEDHANGKQVEQATYELKGAYLMHYRNSAGVVIEFDDHGKPKQVLRNQQVLNATEAAPLINAARTRVAVLRSHALSATEVRRHRDETEDPAKLAAMQTRLKSR